MNVLSARCSNTVLRFCAAISLTMIIFRLGVMEGLYAAEGLEPFATFAVREVDIDIEDGEIEMAVSFTLGRGSNGLNVANEPVSLQVAGGTAAYSVIMPAGSFKISKSGEFTFLGTIKGVKIIASIRSSRAGVFEFELVTERADVRGMANPVAVNLSIGDNGGSKSVRAKIE